jgi:hypothetical protein
MEKNSLFNKCGWEKWLSAYHPVLGPYYQTQNLAVNSGETREYSGSNSYKQGLPQLTLDLSY